MTLAFLLAAAWISDGRPVLDGPAAYGDDPAPVFSRTFAVDAPDGAELKIAALGYYDVEVNGAKLSRTTLMPLWTVADRTILEDAYPVGVLLRPGANTVRVTLGNGWYNPLPMKMFGRWNFRDYIANRLKGGYPIGQGPILTLSKAVRNAIHAAESTYGIENIIITQKGWTISPAPN